MSESTEHHLNLYYSLSDYESDSENEADEEAAFDLEELKYAELDENYFDDDELERTKEVVREDENGFESEEWDIQTDHSDSGEDDDTWNQNTTYLDQLEDQHPPYDSIGTPVGIDEDDDVDVIDYFNKIWDLAIISKIIEQTNLYASEELGGCDCG